MASTSLSPTQSLISLFSSLQASQPTMESALSSIYSDLLSSFETNPSIHSSLLRLQKQINSQKSLSRSLVATPHAESIRYLKLLFTTMALTIITLSIFVRNNAKAIRKDAPNRKNEIPITRTQMIAWVLSFVLIVLSTAAMGVTLSYITDRDRENGYSWDECGLWVVFHCCVGCAISAVSSLGSTVWASRGKVEGKNKRDVKR